MTLGSEPENKLASCVTAKRPSQPSLGRERHTRPWHVTTTLKKKDGTNILGCEGRVPNVQTQYVKGPQNLRLLFPSAVVAGQTQEHAQSSRG